MKTRNRIFAILLAFMMVVTYMPALAFADDEITGTEPDVSGVQTEETQLHDQDATETGEEPLIEQQDEESDPADDKTVENTDAVTKNRDGDGDEGGETEIFEWQYEGQNEGQAVLYPTTNLLFWLPEGAIIPDPDEYPDVFTLRVGINDGNFESETHGWVYDFTDGNEYDFDPDEMELVLHGDKVASAVANYTNGYGPLPEGWCIALFAGVSFDDETDEGWIANGTCRFADNSGDEGEDFGPLTISLDVDSTNILINEPLEFYVEASGEPHVINIYKDYDDEAEPDYVEEDREEVSSEYTTIIYEEPGDYVFRVEAVRYKYDPETEEYTVDETVCEEEEIHVERLGETGEFLITKVNNNTNFTNGITVIRDDNVTIECEEPECGNGVAEHYWVEAYIYDPQEEDGKGQSLGFFAVTEFNTLHLHTITFEAGEYVLCVGANAPGYSSNWSDNSFRMTVNDLDVPEGEMYFRVSEDELTTGEIMDFSVYCPGAESISVFWASNGDSGEIDYFEGNSGHGAYAFRQSFVGELVAVAERYDEDLDDNVEITRKTIPVTVTSQGPVVITMPELPDYIVLSELTDDLSFTVEFPEHADEMTVWVESDGKTVFDETSDEAISVNIDKDDLVANTVLWLCIEAWGDGYDFAEKERFIPVVGSLTDEVTMSLDIDEGETVLINQRIDYTVTSTTSDIESIKIFDGRWYWTDDWDEDSFEGQLMFDTPGTYTVLVIVKLAGSDDDEWVSCEPVTINVESYGQVGGFSIEKVNGETDFENGFTVTQGDTVILECGESQNADSYRLQIERWNPNPYNEFGWEYVDYHPYSRSNIIEFNTIFASDEGPYRIRVISSGTGYEERFSNNELMLTVNPLELDEGEVYFSLSDNAQGVLDTCEPFTVSAYCKDAARICVYRDYDNDRGSFDENDDESGAFFGEWTYDRSGTYKLVAEAYGYDEEEEWVKIGESDPITVTVQASEGESLSLSTTPDLPAYLKAGEDDLSFEVDMPDHADEMWMYIDRIGEDEDEYHRVFEDWTDDTEDGKFEVDIPADDYLEGDRLQIRIEATGRGYDAASIDKWIPVIGDTSDLITVEASKTDILVNENISVNVRIDEEADASEVYIYNSWGFDGPRQIEEDGTYEQGFGFDEPGQYTLLAKAKVNTGNDEDEEWIYSEPVIINVTSLGKTGEFHITGVNSNTDPIPASITVERGDIITVACSEAEHANEYWVDLEKLFEEDGHSDWSERQYIGHNKRPALAFGTADLEPGEYRFRAMANGKGYENSRTSELISLTVNERSQTEDKMLFAVSKTEVLTNEQFVYSAYYPGAENIIIYFDYGKDNYWPEVIEEDCFTNEFYYTDSGEYTLCAEAYGTDPDTGEYGLLARKSYEITVEAPNGGINIKVPSSIPEYLTPEEATVSFAVEKPEESDSISVNVWAEDGSGYYQDLYHYTTDEGSLNAEINAAGVPVGATVYISIDANGLGYERSEVFLRLPVIDAISDSVSIVADSTNIPVHKDVNFTVTAVDENASISKVQFYNGYGFRGEESPGIDGVFRASEHYNEPGTFIVYARVWLEGSDAYLTCEPVSVTVTSNGKLALELPTTLHDQICASNGLEVTVPRPVNANYYELAAYYDEEYPISVERTSEDDSLTLYVPADELEEDTTLYVRLSGWGEGYEENSVSKAIEVVDHELTEHQRVEPGCTQAGVEAYWSCSNCGKVFLDAECTNETTLDLLTIPATGHHYENGVCTNCGEPEPGIIASGDYWKLYDTGQLVLSGMENFSSVVTPWSAYKENIYSVRIEPGVTYVGNCAFANCSNLSSVEIPSTVTSLGNQAFANCSNLNSIEIPSSVTSIGDYTFLDCGSLTGITIPGSVTSIGFSAFSGCYSLTSITIPGSVTSIGSFAFSGLNELTSVTIENGVQSIGESAFSVCTRLTSIVIPGSVTTIGDCAFKNCSNLASLTIQDGVTEIGDEAFAYNIKLSSAIIPASVTSIGENAFKNDPLDYFFFGGTVDQWEAMNVDSFEDVAIHFESTGEHTYGGWTVTTPATCTAEGSREKECTVCGHKITEALQIDPDAHDWGAWTECEDGEHHQRVCTYDSTHTETAVHSWNNGEITTPATCGTAGIKTFTCSVCGATRTEAIDATGEHTVEEWTVTQPATCITTGTRTAECAVCHETLTETIPVDPEAHAWGEWTVTTAPTCSAAGEETRICGNNPEHIQTREKAADPTTHAWGDWTDCEDGEHHQRVCSYNDEHVDTETHEWNDGEITTPATCTTAGVKTFTCTVCSATKTEDIAATGEHTIAEWTVTQPATCVATGTRTGECTVCHNTMTEEIPIDSNAHAWGDWTDCGDGEHHQRVCGYNDAHVDTKAHEWDNGEVITLATYFEVGEKEFTCTVCEATKTEEIPKLVGTGWKKIDGYWYFFENDGTMAMSKWKKDSKGWCYLGADGRMVTNGWAPDSKGWCWIGPDGYMVEKTKWIQYEGGWYYIEKGYRVQNKWRKDSKGWCYLGSDGRMVTNDWVKDSKGWCWIGSAGYMVEKTTWIQYQGGWYYIEKGYRVQNKWRKDSKGWCYLGSDGRMVTNGWAKDSKGWCWIGEEGYMIEEDMWIGEAGAAGSSYIIKGYRVDNKTITIDGVEYTFDAEGKLVA